MHQVLEIDARVESTWSSHTPSKSLDPVSWTQLLDWLVCPRSPIKIVDLEILEIPETVWEEAGDIGEVLIERPDATKENLQDLGCALCLCSSIDRVTFGPNCQLGDDGAQVVVETMKGNQSVKQLSFQWNGITMEGVKAVVSTISRYCGSGCHINVSMIDNYCSYDMSVAYLQGANFCYSTFSRMIYIPTVCCWNAAH